MRASDISKFLKCQELLEHYKLELYIFDSHNLYVGRRGSEKTEHVGQTVDELHSYLKGYARAYEADVSRIVAAMK